MSETEQKSMTAQEAVVDLERALAAWATQQDIYVILAQRVDAMSDEEVNLWMDNMMSFPHTPLRTTEHVLGFAKQNLESARASAHKGHELYWSRLLQRLSRAAGL